jgi:hypothetical protein
MNRRYKKLEKDVRNWGLIDQTESAKKKPTQPSLLQDTQLGK